MGEGLELRRRDWSLGPLAKHGSQKRGKANMTHTGPHWLESWTFPLALGMHGILGGDF